jgi:RNA polymerase sigma-70 factor (ECF subfamily)
MRSSWKQLHGQFTRSTRLPPAVRDFASLKATIPALDRFADVPALITFLEDRSASLDEKDAIYAELVKVAQARGTASRTASTLLWLGLWPVLTMLYAAKQHEFASEPEELISEISEWFLTAIDRADLDRIARVAATLARNTARNLAEQQQRDRKAVQLVYVPDLANLPGDIVEAPASGLSVAAELEAVHGWLETVLGEEDADLVVGVTVLGETKADMGEKLGIPREHARKRYRRAIAKVRDEISQ